MRFTPRLVRRKPLTRWLPQLERLEGREVPAVTAALSQVATWQELGPNVITDGQTRNLTAPNPNGGGNVTNPAIGAIQALAPHPTDANIMFAAGPNGGVWRTTNALDASPTWTPISDEVASLTVSDLAIDPDNPNRMLVGIGGTADGRAVDNAVVRGDLIGALYTENALAAKPNWTILRGGLVGKNITNVFLRSPIGGNPGYMLVGTDAGVFRSTDNGVTFTNALRATVNNGVTFFDRTFAEGVYDMAENPRLRNQFYMATRTGPGLGAGGEVWRSDNGGVTWGRVTDPKMQLNDRTVNVQLSMRDGGASDNQVYVAVANDRPTGADERAVPGIGAPSAWPNRDGVLTSVCWSANQGGDWTRMDTPRWLTAPSPLARDIDGDGINDLPNDLDQGLRVILGDAGEGGGVLVESGAVVVRTLAPHRLRTGDRIYLRNVLEYNQFPPVEVIGGFFNVTVRDEYTFTLDGAPDPAVTLDSTQAWWQRVVGANPGEKGQFLQLLANPNNPNLVYLGGDFSQWRFAYDDPQNWPGGTRKFDVSDPNNSPLSFTGTFWVGDRFRNPTPPGDGSLDGYSYQWQSLNDTRLAARGTVANPLEAQSGTPSGTAPGGDTREMVFDAAGNLWVGTGTGIYHRRVDFTVQGTTGVNTTPFDWSSANGNIGVGQFWSAAYDSLNNVIVGAMQDTGAVDQIAAGNLSFRSLTPNTDIDPYINDINGRFPIARYGFAADRSDFTDQEYAYATAVDNTSNPNFAIRYTAASSFFAVRRRVYDATNTLIPGGDKPLNFADAFSTTTRLSGITAADLALAQDPSAVIVLKLNANDEARAVYGLTSVYEDSDPNNVTGWIVSNVTPPGMSGRVRSMFYGGKRDGIRFNQILFVGTTTGQLFVRGEFGVTFNQIAPGTGPVTDIEQDPDDWRRVFVAQGGRIYETRNADAGAGVVWTDLTSNVVTPLDPATGLPSGGGLTTELRTIALFDPNPGAANINATGDVVMLAGGRGGVYRLNLSTCGPNPIWSEYGNGLPNTVVTDLEVEGNRLLAATFGRGVWTVPDVRPTLLNTQYLDIFGTNAPDNIYIEADPLDPFALFVDDGTGFRQRFTYGQFDEIRIQSLGGADTLLVDSNGPAPGGTTSFVNAPIRVNMGNDFGDTIIFNDETDTRNVHVTVTPTSVGVAVLGGTDNIFSLCGLVSYNGLDNGALVLNTGNGNDRIVVGGGGLPLPRGLVLNGGTGDDTYDLVGPFTGGSSLYLKDPAGIDSVLLSVPGLQTAVVDAAGNRLAVGGLNLILDGNVENVFLDGQLPGSSLQWFGTPGNDAVYLMQDPADPLNYSQILSGTFAVRFRGMNAVGIYTLAGADLVQVDSNGAAPGGTTGFVTYAVNVALGGDASDTLIVDSSGATAPLRVDVSPSAIAGPFGGVAQVGYSGIAAGALYLRTGSGDDTIVVDASVVTSGVVDAGGGGDDLWLIGTPGDDLFTVAGSTVVANNLRLQPTFNVEQVVAVGLGGYDTLSTFGSVASESVTVQQSGPLSGVVSGFQLPVRFDSTEAVNIDAGAGGNALLWEDTSNTSIGAARFPDEGLIFAPTGPLSGEVRVGRTGTVTRFTNIPGAFRMNGDPTGSNSRDVLTVLGASSTAAGASSGELLVDNGSDVITANDSGVQINNASVGALRSVAFGNTPSGGASFSTVLVKGGNEVGTGDTVFAPTTNRLNLVLDGGDPALPPGDTLIAATAGAAASSFVDNAAFGPPQTRITDRGLGSSLGHLNFESVTATIGGGGGPPAFSPPSAQIFAVGSDAGFPATVRVYNSNGTLRFNLNPFPGFTGGVRVAVGDVTGDGAADVVAAAGPGGGPAVTVFDGTTGKAVRTFFAYNSKFTGGVNVAVGYFDSDSFADIVVGAGAGGGPHVKVISGANGSELLSFFAFAPTTNTGVTVAAGDFTGSGQSDIVVGAGPGGGPAVKVFDGRTAAELQSFFGMPPAFPGGVNVAAGDITGDGRADIVVGAGPGGATQVLVFDGTNPTAGPIRNFIVNDPNVTGVPPINITSGVRVAASDMDGDGLADILVGRGRGTRPFAQLLKVTSRLGGGGVFEVSDRLLAVNVFGDSYSNGIFVGS